MRTYDMATIRIIIGEGGCKDLVRLEENGVFPNSEIGGLPATETDILQWIPACELDEPDAPDLLKTPGLPAPFTANELAAFMLHGAGWFLSEKYGDWHGGPDDEALKSMGLLANRAQEAVKGAYAAYRTAELIVGDYEKKIDVHVEQLTGEYQQKLQEANMKEGVNAKRIARVTEGDSVPVEVEHEKAITEEEYWARRARATQSVAELLKSLRAAQKQADQHSARWRKAMVRQLLQPLTLPVVAAGASGGLEQVTGKRWTPEKLAEVKLHREKHGTKKTAEHFGVSEQLIRQKLPSEKPQPKGYSAFTQHTK